MAKTSLTELIERRDLEYYGGHGYLIAKGPEGYAKMTYVENHKRLVPVSASHRAREHSRCIGYYSSISFYDDMPWREADWVVEHLKQITSLQAYRLLYDEVRWRRKELAARLQELIQQEMDNATCLQKG